MDGQTKQAQFSPLNTRSSQSLAGCSTAEATLQLSKAELACSKFVLELITSSEVDPRA
jgi:hypothetical protein